MWMPGPLEPRGMYQPVASIPEPIRAHGRAFIWEQSRHTISLRLRDERTGEIAAQVDVGCGSKTFARVAEGQPWRVFVAGSQSVARDLAVEWVTGWVEGERVH